MAVGVDDVALMLGGQALGGMMQSDAAGKAAGQQSNAIDRATALSNQQYQITRNDQAPLRNAGNLGIMELLRRMGLGSPDGGPMAGAWGGSTQSAPTLDGIRAERNAAHISNYGVSLPAGADEQAIQGEYDRRMSEWNANGGKPAPAPVSTDPTFGSLNKKFSLDDFWQDPVTQASYQSGLDLGTKALKNAAPLTTGLDSGAAMKELTKFGTDYTGQQAAGSQARYEGTNTNVFNRLMGLIGGGQQANQVTANAGQANVGTTAPLIASMGNAQGASTIAGANAWGGAINNIANWWNQNQMLDKLKSFTPSMPGMSSVQNWASPSFNPNYAAG